MSFGPTDKIGGLSDEKLVRFLAEPWNARIATVAPDGWPYITPVWYDFEVERRTFIVVGRERAEWVRYIKRGPKVALLVPDEIHAQHTRMNVQGIAEIVEGPVVPVENPRLNVLVERMSLRYLGPSGLAYASLTAGRPRVVVRITPTRWRT